MVLVCMESVVVRMIASSGRRKRCVAHPVRKVASEDAMRLLQCMARGRSSGSHVQRKKQRSSISLNGNPALAPAEAMPPLSSSAPQNSPEGNVVSEIAKEGSQPAIPPVAVVSEPAEHLTHRDLAPGVGNHSFVKVISGEDDGVSARTFYGSNDRRDKPREILRLFSKIQKAFEDSLVALPEPSSSGGLWVTFPRQDMAFQFADSHGEEGVEPPRVFVYQDHVSHSRRFLVTTIDQFWTRYSTMPAALRHHYEVIRQGQACHLYFDLEFDRVANPSADGQAMVSAFLSLLSELLREVYEVEYDDSWTVELDSSTPDKFSVHLIVHISGAAFKNNSHVGAFAKELSSRINEGREHDSKCAQLFVRTKDDSAEAPGSVFLDLAVYTRNRHFRLPLSTKAGKTAVLLPTNRYRCKELDQKGVFMDSVISLVDSTSCSKLLTFGSEMSSQAERSKPSSVSSHAGGQVTGTSRSPFPAIQDFIEAISSVGDVPGTVRSWAWFADYGTLVFNIAGNRFCENIGRAHKSNNVLYCVSFRMGGYYQMCHDPDCRGYKSDVRPIPRHLLPPQFPFLSPDINAHPEWSQPWPCSQNTPIANAASQQQGTHTCTCTWASTTQPLPSLNRPGTSGEEDAAWWDEVILLADEVEARADAISPLSCQSNSMGEAEEVEAAWWTEVVAHYGHVTTC